MPLITRFRELTGVPLVLNTSFNDQEPLVATPDDALKTFARDRDRCPLSGRSPCPKTTMTARLRDRAASDRRDPRWVPRADAVRAGAATDMAGGSRWFLATMHRRRLPLLRRRAMFPLRHRGRGGAAFDHGDEPPALGWFREYYLDALDSISHLVAVQFGLGAESARDAAGTARRDPCLRPLSPRAFVSSRSIRAEVLYQARDSPANPVGWWRTDHGPADSRHRIGRRSDPQRDAAESHAACCASRGYSETWARWRPNMERIDRSRREHRDRRAGNDARNGRGTTRPGRRSSPCKPGLEHGVNRRPESAPVLYWSRVGLLVFLGMGVVRSKRLRRPATTQIAQSVDR